MIKRRRGNSLLKQPRHAAFQIPIEAIGEKPSHIPQQRREQNRSEYRNGIIRRRVFPEGAEGGVAEPHDPRDAEDLGEDRVEEFAGEGSEEEVADVGGEAVDGEEAEEAGAEEDVVGEHGGGTAHEHVGEEGSAVAGGDAFA
mmetsp:Transcript_4619/g.10183  ORF Transcript_4619/g.10183 Transcript_4619/m.10183 type:complete len:142 (-) Transcript_4619:247-672(-)